jgi:hypothetical protein
LQIDFHRIGKRVLHALFHPLAFPFHEGTGRLACPRLSWLVRSLIPSGIKETTRRGFSHQNEGVLLNLVKFNPKSPPLILFRECDS